MSLSNSEVEKKIVVKDETLKISQLIDKHDIMYIDIIRDFFETLSEGRNLESCKCE